MYYLFFLIMAMLFCTALWLEERELSSPGVLMTLAFVIAAVCCIQGQNSWNSTAIKESAIGIIFIGIVSFLFTGFLVREYMHRVFIRKQPNCPRFNLEQLQDVSVRKVDILLLLVMALSVFYLIDVMHKLATYGYSTKDFTAISAGYHDLGFRYGISARSQLGTVAYIFCYCSSLVIAAVFFSKYYAHKLTKGISIKLITAFVFSLLPLAITGLRTYVGHAVISIVVGTLLYRMIYMNKKIKIIPTIIAVCIGFPIISELFFALLALVGRITDLQLDATSYLTYYLGVSIPNLQLWLDQNLPSLVGIDELFSAFHTTLYQHHLAANPGENSSLAFLEGGSNVYTIFKPAYNDFGIVGVILYSALLAIVFYGLYESVKHSCNAYTFIVYILLSFMMIESIRDDFMAYWFGLNLLYYLLAIYLILLLIFGLKTPARPSAKVRAREL